MVVNDTIDILSALPVDLVGRIDFLVTILQAVGGFIILWIIFNIASVFMNRKKNKEIEKINKNLEEIKRLLSKR
jgi:purine-cytosine permease-like protein